MASFLPINLASFRKLRFICHFFCHFRPITPTQGCTNQTTPRRRVLDFCFNSCNSGRYGAYTMSLATAVIGLATLAVRPAWIPHGRRFERVLKHHHKQQPPQLFPQANLAGLEGLPTSEEVHGLCLESFLRQHLPHRERRHAVGSLLLLAAVRVLNKIRGRYDDKTCQYFQKLAKCAVFRDRKFFCRLFGKCCQIFLVKIAIFWKFRLVVRNNS